MASVKPASGIGPGRAVDRRNPSGLVKPKGFAQEFNAFETSKQVTTKSPASALGSGNGTALPWDSIAEGKASNAQLNRQNTNAQVAANRNVGLQEFGIDAGYDDYKNNPFSQAAILQHNHESNARGINVTAGQAGYSGQTGNAQGAEQGRTNQAHYGIVNENARAKANWTAEEKAAEAAVQREINEAKEGAVDRAAAQPGPEVPLGNEGGKGGGSQPKEKIPYPAPANKKWAWNGSHWHLVKA